MTTGESQFSAGSRDWVFSLAGKRDEWCSINRPRIPQITSTFCSMIDDMDDPPLSMSERIARGKAK